MADIAFDCPHCGDNLIVDATAAGRQVPCPVCRKLITIPASEPISLGNEVTRAAPPAPTRPDLQVSLSDQRTTGGATTRETLGRVDRYALLRKVGEGGFGSVWQARDEETGIEVALKALPSLLAVNPDELLRVRNNFAMVSRLTHPNICALRYLHKIQNIDKQAESNLHVSSDGYLVVMDFVEGVTLTQYRLLRGGKLPLNESMGICRQIAVALDYAHTQKVIHRDIKPGNIMVTDSASVKVLDFGLAAEVRSSMSRVSRDIVDTSGTRPYMAPEQWLGQKQDSRTDQYALAALFYELVSGEVPFSSAFDTNDPVVMLNVVKNETPEKLSELSSGRNSVLLRALSKGRDSRWISCVEFIDAIEKDRAISASETQPPTPVIKIQPRVTVPVPERKSEEAPALDVAWRAPEQPHMPKGIEKRPAHNMGPRGRERSAGATILWTILSLGLYPLFWMRDMFDEARSYAHGRRGVSIRKGSSAQNLYVGLPILILILGVVLAGVLSGGDEDTMTGMTLLVVVAISIQSFLGWIAVPGLIRKMRIAQGIPPDQAGHPGAMSILMLIPYLGPLLYVPVVQSAMNRFWREEAEEGGVGDGRSTSSSSPILIIVILVGVIGLLAAIAIPSFVRARTTSQNNACINNLRQMDGAKDQWAIENNKMDDDRVTLDDISPYIKGGRPQCPAGGRYEVTTVGDDPTCTIPGHGL